MRLNLQVLSDSLKDYKHTLVTDNSIEMNLIGIRSFPSDMQKLSLDYIYLVNANFLITTKLSGSDISLLILGDIDENYLKSMSLKAIIIPSDVSMQDVFEQILSIFDFYNQWDNGLTGSIISSQTIQSQLDICAKALDNPIALFDTSYVLIAKAGIMPENYSGTVWESVLEKGYSTVDYIPSEYRLIDGECIKSHKPIIYPPLEKPADMRFLSATLQKENIPFAKIGMLNNQKEFTLGQLSLIWHIQKVLENSPLYKFNLSITPDGTSYLLDNLLHGKELDPHILNYYLQQQKWSNNEDFYVISFLTRLKNEFTPNDYQSYLFIIRQSLVFSYVAYIDNTLVAICRCKQEINTVEDINDRLSPLLRQTDMIAGISMRYKGYEFLHCAFLQSKEALRVGDKLYTEKNCHSFEDIYIDNIMNILGDIQNIRYYCHPMINRILCHNDPWELELVQTLGEYLLHGRSISATASKLFIHRNTLINRIEAIEKILGINLNSIDESTLQILQFSCWIAKYLDNSSNNESLN